MTLRKENTQWDISNSDTHNVQLNITMTLRLKIFDRKYCTPIYNAELNATMTVRGKITNTQV